MFGIFKSRIDKLADKRKSLMEKREKATHRFQVEQAKLSAEITRLQLKSYELDDTSKKTEKQLNFKIDKVMKEIEAENEYVKAVTIDEQDEYLKDHKNQEPKEKKGK
jgi:hypothetical protein